MGHLLVAAQRLMLTLRAGTALQLILTNGRKVTVSTPDPEAAADAINQGRHRDA